MLQRQIVSYTLTEVKEGFVARSSTNDFATAFGKTRDEAGNNLVQSIQEYLKLYPEKHGQIFNGLIKEIDLDA